jgi:hypothetical protein
MSIFTAVYPGPGHTRVHPRTVFTESQVYPAPEVVNEGLSPGTGPGCARPTSAMRGTHDAQDCHKAITSAVDTTAEGINREVCLTCMVGAPLIACVKVVIATCHHVVAIVVLLCFMLGAARTFATGQT